MPGQQRRSPMPWSTRTAAVRLTTRRPPASSPSSVRERSSSQVETESAPMRYRLPNRNAWLATALVATPVLFIAAEILSPALKSTAARQLDVVAAHSSRWYWYTVLLVAGSVTFIPAVFGAARVASARSPRLASAGMVLMEFGAIVAVGDAITQFVIWQMAKQPGRAGMAMLLDHYNKSAAE